MNATNTRALLTLRRKLSWKLNHSYAIPLWMIRKNGEVGWLIYEKLIQVFQSTTGNEQ